MKAVLLALTLLMALTIMTLGAHPASALPLEDDFNDNVRDTELWDYNAEGGGALNETNQRLEYTSPGQVGERETSYILKPGLPYDVPWVLTVELHVEDLAGPESFHEYGWWLTIFNAADDGDLHAFGRERGWNGSPGYKNYWIYEGTVDEGPYDHEVVNASGSEGTLKIVWDGASFSCYFDEGSGFQPAFPGLSLSVAGWNMSPGSSFGLGLSGADQNVPFALDNGSESYADNFFVPEPSAALLQAAALMALMGLATRRRN